MMKVNRVLKRARVLVSCFIGNELARYEARHAVLSELARWCSLRMYNRNLRWLNDDTYLSVWRGFAEGDGNIAERKFSLFYLAKSIRAVDGDTAECGAFRGATSYLILRASEGRNKLHHIFDSFEGLSKPMPADRVEIARVFKWNAGDLAVSEDVVCRNLQGFDNVSLYKGWIPSRFSEVKDRRFSFVHLDVDLYQPTIESLRFFYDRTNRGGIIVCDDYGFESCPGAYKAMNEFFTDKPEEVIHLTTGQGVVVKQ